MSDGDANIKPENKIKNKRSLKPERKNDTVYSRFLSRYKWYCPNTFGYIDAALSFLAAILAFIALPYALIPVVRICGGFMSSTQLYCLSAVLSQAVIIGVAAVFCKIRNVPLFSGGGFGFEFDFKAFLPAVLLTVATAILLEPVHTEFSEILGQLRQLIVGTQSSGDVVLEIMSFNDVFALLFVYCIVVPVFPAICEEALFRGVIARGLKGLGDFRAAVLSGFLFAIMHGNYSQFLLQFILGVEIGYFVLKTGNFAVGAVMHFVNNAFALVNVLVLALAETLVSTEFALILKACLIVFGAICLFLSFYLWARYQRKKGAANKYKTDEKLCCLKRIDASDENAFVVKEGLIKTTELRRQNGFENCLYFYKGRFVKFNESDKRRKNILLTVCFMSVAIIIAVALIVLDFFA